MYLKPENKRTITFTNCVNRPTLFPRINKINLNKILIFFPPMNCFTSSHKGFHCNFLDNHTHELYDVMVKYDWLFLPKAIIQSESDQKQNSMTFSYLVFFIFPYHLFCLCADEFRFKGCTLMTEWTLLICLNQELVLNCK